MSYASITVESRTKSHAVFEGLEVFLAGTVLTLLLLTESLSAATCCLIITLTAFHEVYGAQWSYFLRSTGDNANATIEQEVRSKKQTIPINAKTDVSLLTTENKKRRSDSGDSRWGRFGHPSIEVLGPNDVEFQRRREEYRRSLIVPGVSRRSEFDMRRQQLAESALDELKKLIEAEYASDPNVSRFLSDISCYRFLRARDGNAQAAMAMIRTTIEWRRKKGLLYERAICKVCRDVNPRAHAYFFIGYDVMNRAVMYSSSARAIGQRDAEAGIFHMVTEMEQQLDDDQDVAQIVWVVDFKGFSASHANPRLGIEAIHLFQQVYPERLGQLVLLGFPLVFTFFFKICAPLLDPVTRNKIVILRSHEERRHYYNEYWTQHMIDWIKQVEQMPAKPGVFPDSETIRGRYWG